VNPNRIDLIFENNYKKIIQCFRYRVAFGKETPICFNLGDHP